MGVGLSAWPNDARHLAAVERIFPRPKPTTLSPSCMAPGGGGQPNLSIWLYAVPDCNDMRMLTAATADAIKAYRAR